MDDYHDEDYWRHRVQELESKVTQLRLSRRILMNLIEKMEREKIFFLDRLEKENKKLLQDNYKYARSLFEKNSQIVALQSKLKRRPN